MIIEIWDPRTLILDHEPILHYQQWCTGLQEFLVMICSESIVHTDLIFRLRVEVEIPTLC
jgi:hypothetical protein